MATLNELSQQYTRRISEAIAKDGFTKYSKVTTASLSSSSTLRELKNIKHHIDSLVYTGTQDRLSETDKNIIIEGIRQELNLPSQRQMKVILEAASNDDLSDLTDEIENILKGK